MGHSESCSCHVDHMRVRFTHHAQAGMLERGIETSRVVETIRNPNSRFPARDGAIVCVKTFGPKKLKVITKVIFREHAKAEYVIITAYYL